MHIPSRRHFIKNVAILSPFFALLSPHLLASGGVRLRVGFIGLGPWGQRYLSQALQHKQIDVRAICEPDNKALKQSLQLFPTPPDEGDFETLLARKDIDAVVIGTPWHQHYEMAKAAMLAGKHVACGPVMGTTLEEHWDIVRISERSGCQYFTLDESSYRPDLRAVSNMVAAGTLGELQTIHAGARYDVLPEVHEGAALPYPLYPAGAVASVLRIANGNAYATIRIEKREEEIMLRKTNPKTGQSHLHIKRGEMQTIVLTTTTNQEVFLQSGRGEEQPVSTGFRIKGNKGMWMDYSRSLFFASNQNWESDQPYLNQYPVQQQNGMALALQEFVTISRHPVTGYLPVYAAATDSVIYTLAKNATSGVTLDFPDFSKDKTV